MRRRSFAAVVAFALALGMAPVQGQQAANLALLGVPLDGDYRKADRKLTDHLNRVLGLTLTHDDEFNTYGGLIERVSNTKEPYLARMTPYALVAAEMLGARFEVLGTYESKRTLSTTYRSYFVVNRQRFQGNPETLDGIYEYLKTLPKPARFIYHDKFSTSSYLLPALWFRTRRIFATEQPAGAILRVVPVQGPPSSSESVDKVAGDEADLAAVWDGTKSNNPAVVFVTLPQTLPNDLLVASMSVAAPTRNSIRKALDMGAEIGIGDFTRWRNIENEDAREALDALNDLRRVSRAPPSPVVIRVNADMPVGEGSVAAQIQRYADDARQAVRLAGTEFVLEEPTFHKKVDAIWTVHLVHEGAILLTSEIQDANEDLRTRLKQEFHISFTPAEGDLTRRIVSLIHSRMHRVRYVWPYRESAPTVIRDVDFTIPADEDVHVQRLTWRDPDRNEFVPTDSFDTRPTQITPGTFAFDRSDFVRPDSNTLDFQNPLSDVAYRVVLQRRSNESTLSKVLTGAFVALFLLTGVGAAVDIRRRLLPQKPRPPRTLPQVCAALAAQLHDEWRGRPVREADVLFCDRSRVEELIEELKSKGLVPASMGGVTRWAYHVSAGASVPFVKGLLAGGASRHVDLVLDPARVGSAPRLEALLDVMIAKRLLSDFVGRPLEWEGLSQLAVAILPGTKAGELIIRPEDESVINIASHHFNQVLDDSLKRVSLVHGQWSVSRRDDRSLAQQSVRLPGPIVIGDASVWSVVLEFNVSDEVELPLGTGSRTVDCWVLGKVVRSTIIEDAGRPALCLHLRTVALLAAHGPTSALTGQPGDLDGRPQGML